MNRANYWTLPFQQIIICYPVPQLISFRTANKHRISDHSECGHPQLPKITYKVLPFDKLYFFNTKRGKNANVNASLYYLASYTLQQTLCNASIKLPNFCSVIGNLVSALNLRRQKPSRTLKIINLLVGLQIRYYSRVADCHYIRISSKNPSQINKTSFNTPVSLTIHFGRDKPIIAS